MFEIAVNGAGIVSVTEKMERTQGSSKHGKHDRACVAQKKVAAKSSAM
jgi:hypothetical protein